MEKFAEDNNDKKASNWGTYYENNKHLPHSKYLEKAVDLYCPNGGNALDMGAGGFRDTKFLLEKGFSVTAIDAAPESAERAKEITDPHFTMFEGLLKEYPYPKDYFSVVNAQGFLFHFPKDRLQNILRNIYISLQEGGVLVAEFLGKNDDWNIAGNDKTFLTESELEELLQAFEIVYLDEYERDMTTSISEQQGTYATKHWHKFKVIARKNSQ